MIRRWTRIAALILATTLFLSFTSCTTSDLKNPGSASQEDEKVTIRFVSSWGGFDSNADTLQEILNKFMAENKDINVINESVFGADFLPKIKTDFASGNDPDVFGIWPGSDIRLLINKGKVADLTDVLNEDPYWKKSFKTNMWDFTTVNDKVYGLPFEITYEGLFVNKRLFDLFKIKVPETYEELIGAVKAFKKNGVIPIAYNTYPEGTFIYQNLITKLGSKEDIEKPYNNGRFSSCFMDAMNYMKQLRNEGAFPEKTLISDSDRNNLFINGSAAMIVQGSWFIGKLQDEKGVDLVPFPYITGKKTAKNTMIYGLGNGTFYMSQAASSDPKKREASIKLLKALTSKVSAYMFTNQTGMLCNVSCDDMHPNYSPLMLKGRSMLNNADELIGPPDHFVERTVWESTIAENFYYLLEGKKDPEDVWDEAVRIYKINDYK